MVLEGLGAKKALRDAVVYVLLYWKVSADCDRAPRYKFLMQK
jgi:hypothetical protein